MRLLLLPTATSPTRPYRPTRAGGCVPVSSAAVGDTVTSQVIPLALSAVGAGLTLHGIYRMVRGIKE